MPATPSSRASPSTSTTRRTSWSPRPSPTPTATTPSPAGTGTSTASAIFNLGAALPANTSGYTIKLDNPADYTTGPLAGLTLSATNAPGNTTANDSNGVLVGGFSQAAVTTPAPGRRT